MDRQDRIVIASGAFALVFLIAGYLKENDMLFHITFAESTGPAHQIEGEFPSARDAIDWVKRHWRNARCVIASPMHTIH